MTFPSYLLLTHFMYFCSKLKKMYRTIQEEKGKKRAAEDGENEVEEKRPRQQFDKDFTLEPFEGVSPEYMEMSESLLLKVFIYSVTPYCNHTIAFLIVHLYIIIYSNPVRVCVSVRGLLPTCTSIRPAQQRH